MYQTAEEDDPKPGLDYLKQEVPGYWDRRQTILALLDYLPKEPSAAMDHWKRTARPPISSWGLWKGMAYDPVLCLTQKTIEGLWVREEGCHLRKCP